MTHWKTLIEKDHLGAWDMVAPDGKTPKDFTLEIAAVSSVKLKTKGNSAGSRKCVITFKGARKKFVCNVTNGETIQSMYGEHFEEWIGKRITIGQGDVKNPNGRGTVKGIVVRSRRPTGAAESVPDREVDQEMRDQQNAAFDREPGED